MIIEILYLNIKSVKTKKGFNVFKISIVPLTLSYVLL